MEEQLITISGNKIKIKCYNNLEALAVLRLHVKLLENELLAVVDREIKQRQVDNFAK